MGPSRAEWGRVGPVRAEWGWGGVGHALGQTTLRLGPATRTGQVGPVRAEWGWGGVGHALGFNQITSRRGSGYKERPSGAQLNYSKTRPWLKDRPSGAAWGGFGPAAWGRFGSSGAEQGSVGLGFTTPWLQGLEVN